MIDLRRHTLTPFRTKAKLSNGQTITYVGKISHDKYRFMIQTRGSVYTARTYLANGARFDAAGSSITKISRPWQPREGDEVHVYGPIAKQGDVSSWIWGFGERQIFVLGPTMDTGENLHFRMKRHGHSEDFIWLAHVRQMKKAVVLF